MRIATEMFFLLGVLALLASCETGGSALDRPSLEQQDRVDMYHPPAPVYDRPYVR